MCNLFRESYLLLSDTFPFTDGTAGRGHSPSPQKKFEHSIMQPSKTSSNSTHSNYGLLGSGYLSSIPRTRTSGQKCDPGSRTPRSSRSSSMTSSNAVVVMGLCCVSMSVTDTSGQRMTRVRLMALQAPWAASSPGACGVSERGNKSIRHGGEWVLVAIGYSVPAPARIRRGDAAQRKRQRVRGAHSLD